LAGSRPREAPSIALSLRKEGRGGLSLPSFMLPEPTIEFSKIKVGQPWGCKSFVSAKAPNCELRPHNRYIDTIHGGPAHRIDFICWPAQECVMG
jgi:hypothetical protein